MVAVSGVSQRGGPRGWAPQASPLGLASGTMSIYVPAAPWTLESSPEQGGTLQEGPSFHQPPYAHPTFSSQKTPQPAPGAGRAQPWPRPRVAVPLRAITWPESRQLRVSVSMCLISVSVPTPTPFARALLEPFCPSVDCTPQRPLPAPRSVSVPCGHRCWYCPSEIPSQPVCCPGAVCSHFLEKIQGPPLGKVPGPSSQAE